MKGLKREDEARGVEAAVDGLGARRDEDVPEILARRDDELDQAFVAFLPGKSVVPR